MLNLKADFEERIDEVNQFFSFMSSINEIDSHRKSATNGSTISVESLVNRDIQKILRSQCFLMLYNLIEATLRIGIQTILDSINDEKIQLYELSNKYQDIFLLSISSKYAEKSNKKGIATSLKRFIDQISNEPIQFIDSIDNASGNVDYRFMEDQKKQFGIICKKALSDPENLKKGMLKVKRERNLLAHGNKSFKKAAEMLTPKELIGYKEFIVEYLKIYVDGVERFVLNKKFLKK
jgi:hypothetical protein